MHIPLNESQVSENWKERSKKTNCKTNGCLTKLILVFPVEFNYILLMDSNGALEIQICVNKIIPVNKYIHLCPRYNYRQYLIFLDTILFLCNDTFLNTNQTLNTWKSYIWINHKCYKVYHFYYTNKGSLW